MTLTYRSTIGRRLTVTEGDGNISHLANSSGVSFVQSGSGAQTETTETALRRLVHTAQYDTVANFNTARDALTGTIGLPPNIEVTHSLDGSDYPLTIKTANTEAADFVLAIGDDVASGTRNTILHFGYNPSAGGDRRDATEGAFFTSFESNFNTGSSNLMEWHVQGVHVTDGTSFRPISITVDRSSKSTVTTLGMTQLNIMDRTLANQAFKFGDLTTSAGTLYVEAGSGIAKSANNQQWISQLNGAASSYVELMRLNGSDQLQLVPNGQPVYMGGKCGIGIAPSTTTDLLLTAGVAGASSLRIPHGAAPTSPVDGDVWTTTAGLFVRVNGATVGPLS